MELSGRVAVVTGSTRGIGRALAEELHCRGVTVAGCSISGDARQGAATVDVASATAVQLFVKSVFDKHGRIDIAIANAGVIDKPLAVQAIAVERFQRVMRTNVDGVFHLLRAVLPVFIAQGHGLIAIIGSRAGHRGHPKLSSYCASKFAVRGLFESLSRELSEARLPIETILFSPAAVDTEMRAVLDDVCSGRKHQSPHRVAELMIEIMTATRG
jgi:NAD(P)-dependent dehydrogenase (short-subunit alcohol dehydrogenase family)